eukprot:sb/3464919/
MTRYFVILPYNAWILHRLLNILILLSALFLWYLTITNQEALNWYFVDRSSAPNAVHNSASGVQHPRPQQKDHVFEGIVEELSVFQGIVEEVSVVHVEPKKEPTVKPNKLQPVIRPTEFPILLPEPDDVSERFKERNIVVKEVCEFEEFPDFKQSNMYYIPDIRATWLPLFGASSATWKKFLIDQYYNSKGRKMIGDHYNLAKLSKFLLQYKKAKKREKGAGKKSRKFIKEPDDSLRFTIIRHPLSRLIAHFQKPQLDRGELVALKDQWVRPSIILGRNDPSWTDEQREKFEGELDQWIDEKLTPEQSLDNPLLSAPTFPEFVRFIVDADAKGDDRAYNVHWRPISEWLDVCQNDIDIIVKMEKMSSEIPVLLEQLHLTNYEGYFLHNADRAEDLGGFMGQLSRHDQERINNFYEMDYSYFGYKPVFVD